MKKEKTLTRREIICLALAVRDAYMAIDQEEWCDEGWDRCGVCSGCHQYKNLQRAWKIAKLLLPKNNQN